MMRLNSIRARMTASFSFAIGILILLTCGALITYARLHAEQEAKILLQTTAQKLQRELSSRNGSEAISEVAEEERDLASDSLTLVLTNLSGQVVYKSRNAVSPESIIGSKDWRIVKISIDTKIATIALPLEKTAHVLRSQAVFLSILGMIVFLFSSAGAWVLVGRTLTPIAALTSNARSASADNLQIRLAPSSKDIEIVELVQTLNGLLARLEESTASRGRFYVAASHELRTPLQALSGHLELALSRERENEEYKTAIQEAFQQTTRLTTLVCDLLTLNRLDSAFTKPHSETVYPLEICERVVCYFKPQIDARKLNVEFEEHSEARIFAPPTHVDMMTRNLIENAVKYTTPGGSIYVVSSASELTISNSFPGAQILDIERLFEPFFRPDDSRNEETGGNGLGLAICSSIAKANGWGLRLSQKDDRVYLQISW